jgi:hypothetical protein
LNWSGLLSSYASLYRPEKDLFGFVPVLAKSCKSLHGVGFELIVALKAPVKADKLARF